MSLIFILVFMELFCYTCILTMQTLQCIMNNYIMVLQVSLKCVGG